jgi:hypothetical protein
VIISAKPSSASHIQKGTMKSNINAPAKMAIPASNFLLLHCLMRINSTPVTHYMRPGAAECQSFNCRGKRRKFSRGKYENHQEGSPCQPNLLSSERKSSGGAALKEMGSPLAG